MRQVREVGRRGGIHAARDPPSTPSAGQLSSTQEILKRVEASCTQYSRPNANGFGIASRATAGEAPASWHPYAR